MDTAMAYYQNLPTISPWRSPATITGPWHHLPVWVCDTSRSKLPNYVPKRLTCEDADLSIYMTCGIAVVSNIGTPNPIWLFSALSSSLSLFFFGCCRLSIFICILYWYRNIELWLILGLVREGHCELVPRSCFSLTSQSQCGQLRYKVAASTWKLYKNSIIVLHSWWL